MHSLVVRSSVLCSSCTGSWEKCECSADTVAVNVRCLSRLLYLLSQCTMDTPRWGEREATAYGCSISRCLHGLLGVLMSGEGAE